MSPIHDHGCMCVVCRATHNSADVVPARAPEAQVPDRRLCEWHEPCPNAASPGRSFCAIHIAMNADRAVPVEETDVVLRAKMCPDCKTVMTLDSACCGECFHAGRAALVIPEASGDDNPQATYWHTEWKKACAQRDVEKAANDALRTEASGQVLVDREPVAYALRFTIDGTPRFWNFGASAPAYATAKDVAETWAAEQGYEVVPLFAALEAKPETGGGA